MAFSLPSTVSVGQIITAAHLNAIRTSLDELQNALSDIDVPLVRRRMTRASTSYASGIQQIFPDTNIENVGGITGPISGELDVPSNGTYLIMCEFDATASPGTASYIGCGIAGAPVTYFPVPSVATVVGFTHSAFLAAGEGVTFWFGNGTGGSLTATIEVEITKLTRI